MALKSLLESPLFGDESCLFAIRSGNKIIIKGILSIGELVPLIIYSQWKSLAKKAKYIQQLMIITFPANKMLKKNYIGNNLIYLLSLVKNHCNEIGKVC